MKHCALGQSLLRDRRQGHKSILGLKQTASASSAGLCPELSPHRTDAVPQKSWVVLQKCWAKGSLQMDTTIYNLAMDKIQKFDARVSVHSIFLTYLKN